jgi:polyferredoxin
MGALLWSLPAIASLLSIDETPLNSWELMGTFGMMLLLVGAVGLLSRVGPLRSVKVRPGSPADRRFRWTKFALLLLVPPTTWFFDTLFFTDLDPVGGITATVPELLLSPQSWSANQFFWLKMFFTASVMVSISLVDRFWCRYLCPIGAMYGPTNKFSLTDIEFKEDSCIHCQKCIGACPMGINPKEDKLDMECIRCGRCIDVCPVKAQKAVVINPRLRRLIH